MNAYYDIRSSCPPRLFSYVLLDVPQRVRLRRPYLREAHDPLQAEEQQVPRFGLGRLATAFMKNPG